VPLLRFPYEHANAAWMSHPISAVYLVRRGRAET
jgi:hypothetical protein